jgi:hypothetical protein
VTLLPVSGMTLAVREPTGEDEVYVLETTLAPLPAILELARRVASTSTGGPVDWPSLPATDLDAAALMIRWSWIGGVISTDASCPGAGCRERIDVSFGRPGLVHAGRGYCPLPAADRRRSPRSSGV